MSDIIQIISDIMKFISEQNNFISLLNNSMQDVIPPNYSKRIKWYIPLLNLCHHTVVSASGPIIAGEFVAVNFDTGE